jgi:hypothetical protein
VPFALACAFALAQGRGRGVPRVAPSPEAAIAAALATTDGLAVDARDVLVLRGAAGVWGSMRGGARAVVRARQVGEPSDLYLVGLRLSPEGELLAIERTWNVTRTTGVDESMPVLRGSLLAYTTSAGEVVTAVHTIDLAGEDPEDLADFTATQRRQIALQNLQATGQTRGIVHASYGLDPAPSRATVAFTDAGTLRVDADGRRIVLDPASGRAIEGAGWVRPAPAEARARPGNLITWSVDRVRQMPIFGDERMQWVKFIAFTALDKVVRARSSVLGDDTGKEVADDMAGLTGSVETFTDPEIGFPPKPIEPLLSPPLPSEGKWVVLENDPFMNQAPGAPPAFATTFLRSDKERKDTRVYVTIWDARQVALHMEAGTVEPVSASGEAGPGAIPRTPEVMRRVVAGFNGGFQAQHGEYGMQANGVLYLPPKPYAATVLELKDGTTGFGSWPATTDVPEEILSYRQNLTALVENGKFNPWGRVWWGGTPPGWADTIHTTRSGLCLTEDAFVAYFWGNDLSAEALAAAMLRARCSYGMHLDMNPGLAGFEFYNAKPESEWKPLARPLQKDWEYEGTFKALPGFRYRARRMVRGMQHQNFPQYIHLDARDFFYLTLRDTLPGAPAKPAALPAEPGEGEWRVKGLPQHGFPWALATTQVRASAKRPDVRLSLLRVDPRVARAAASAGTTADTPTTVAFVGTERPRPSTAAVWLSRGLFVVGPDPGEGALAIAAVLPLEDAQASRAAACVQDEDGMLAWAELPAHVPPDRSTAEAMDAALRGLGCSRVYGVLGAEPRALLGGTLTLTGAPAPQEAATARLVRGEGPSARLHFRTPVVGPAVWQPLQMQRVRYFPKPRVRDAGAEGVDAGPP